jgi:hypothetical protein
MILWRGDDPGVIFATWLVVGFGKNCNDDILDNVWYNSGDFGRFVKGFCFWMGFLEKDEDENEDED